jgi:hypothetical protein
VSTTIADDFARILGRDLDALAGQIGSYPDDASVWRTGGTTRNSAGTLAVHLVGNLEHFVGAVLGSSGYVRDREREFAERAVPRGEILRRIAHCQEVVLATLAGMSNEELARPYPSKTPPSLEGASTHLFLLHLTGHLSWHLGQVDYHRRLLVEGAQPTR